MSGLDRKLGGRDVARVTSSVRYIALAFNSLTASLSMLMTQITPQEITGNVTIDDTYNGATLVDTAGVTITFPAADDVTSPIFNVALKNSAGGATTLVGLPSLATLNPGEHARIKRMGTVWVEFGP